MTENEKEIIWAHIFAISHICGTIACMTGDDEEIKKWVFISAKETRNELCELIDKLSKDLFSPGTSKKDNE